MKQKRHKRNKTTAQALQRIVVGVFFVFFLMQPQKAHADFLDVIAINALQMWQQSFSSIQSAIAHAGAMLQTEANKMLMQDKHNADIGLQNGVMAGKG